MVQSYVTRVIRYIQDVGVSATLSQGIRRLLQAISGRVDLVDYVLIAQPRHGRPRLPERWSRRYAITEVRQNIPWFQQIGRPLPVVDDRYAQRAVCVLAKVREEIHGCIWLVEEVYREDEVRCDFILPKQPKCVWDFDDYVIPEQRSGLAFARLWDAADQLMIKLGASYSLSRIASNNSASLRSHARQGAIRIGRAVFLVIGSLQLMVSSLPPYVDVATSKGRSRLLLRVPESRMS